MASSGRRLAAATVVAVMSLTLAACNADQGGTAGRGQHGLGYAGHAAAP